MAWSIDTASDGRVSASVELQLVVPAVSMIQFTRVRYRRNGTLTYSDAQVVMGTGTKLVKIGGLVPGLFYDFEAATVSGPNESTAATISNQLAPGDTTAPNASQPAVQAQYLREVTLVVATGSELDLAGYEFQVRSATGGGGLLLASGSAVAVKGGSTSKTLTVTSANYGQTLFARCRAKDFTGNPTDPTAGWSVSFSFVLGRTVTDDIGDNTLSTIKIIDSAIATGKIAVSAVSQHLDSGISGLIILTGAFQTIRTQVITTLGGHLRVDGWVRLGGLSKTGALGTLEFHVRNTTTGATSPLGIWTQREAVNDLEISLSTFLHETPGAGTYTLALEARIAAGAWTSPYANQGRVRITEWKR